MSKIYTFSDQSKREPGRCCDDLRIARFLTMAGHDFHHELETAASMGFFGSIDANRGDPRNGWDTDQFPNSFYETTLAMLTILKRWQPRPLRGAQVLIADRQIRIGMDAAGNQERLENIVNQYLAGR